MYKLKKFFFQSPGHYIGAVILTAVVAALRYFALPEGVDAGFKWYESLSVSGYVTFFVGALMMVAYWGAFDLFGYVFSPGRMGGHRKYKDYADYSSQKMAKRAKTGCYFVPYFVVGILVVLISTLFS